MAGRHRRRDEGRQRACRARYAAAQTDEERFAAAVDWLRSSVRYLVRKRSPDPAVREHRKAVASRVIRDLTAQMTSLAERIDRGELA